ncbi:hypothetical protein FC52_GL000599 [Lactobacillus pasteurii DSM 23907 = CRBIP 24.76]|uniref:DUF262 domain-containing protein n=1 Tax=Lactobacillus pasteurii DSM 23907 = CRBIP 24.76 TaxID=1423790 RepID=I7KMD8_9LACO|nr:DUF262 domain-containing protein [Lactobacillus pasteurii]KRK08898.1 hypothetical protein FC52_GL000599 [Lactobacillus pasteurii DSM 23907 = CRBIP 24.76]TDG76267.1 hypothetical protein C5L33_001026 [Lactobacillus pasteurii]CCI86009.1 Putative uncharacterized protein [Lactobacillus pasteurii DSM 23907 = CRBIP 24.76]
MKADSIHLFDFLRNGSRTIFEIPVFQRNYEWGEQQCDQLFKDLVTAAESGQDHFIGAIVYVTETGKEMSHIYRIIDGQQRMMSLTLLLKALADVDEQKREEIKEEYLTNKYFDENNHLKLKPVEHDLEAFQAVMEDKIDQYAQPSKVIENYQYFKKKIQAASLSSSELIDALNHFNMVYIELTNGVQDENPQVIFESLNSTGVSLSASDLVRNFLLMELDSESQARLYKEYWAKMEQIFTTNTFAEFVRNYLIMKTHKKINKGKIYPLYKSFYQTAGLNSEDALKDLYRFAVFYRQLMHAETGNQTLDEILNNINIMDSKVIYPYLLMMLDMAATGETTIETVIEVAKIFESFLFRLKACDRSTNFLNGIVVSLCDKDKAENDYRRRLLYMLSLRFPDDKELAESLMEVNLYKQRNLAKLALVVLEKSRTKETIDFEDAQVEHIMPQRLNNDWRLEVQNADKVNEEFGGVIGNLALTKYNQEMSNKVYSKKKEQYINSNVTLTREIAINYPEWNKESIIDRTQKLTQELISIFPKPSDKVRVEELSGEHAITESVDITGKKPTRITISDEDIQLDSWRKMLIGFMEYIWNLDSRNYEKIRNDSSLNKMLFEGNRRSPERLDNGVVIETNFSASVILAIIAKIAEICDIADEVSYTVK